MTGGADSYALLYAPNAPVVIGGGGVWYGAGISQSLSLTGGSMLYYDRALGSTTGAIRMTAPLPAERWAATCQGAPVA